MIWPDRIQPLSPEAFDRFWYFGSPARTAAQAAASPAVAAGIQAKVEGTLVLGWPGRAVEPGAEAVAAVVEVSTAAMGVFGV